MYIKMVLTKFLEKDGKKLISKEGKELIEYRFEKGDIFIPLYNSVISNKKEVEIKGKKKTIVNYSIKAKVKSIDGKLFIDRDKNDEVYISLTPTQAKSLQSKLDNGLEINQVKFTAYEYDSKDYPDEKFIGLGMGDNKKAKSFEDFEEDEE